jgi:hypothetical protein
MYRAMDCGQRFWRLTILSATAAEREIARNMLARMAKATVFAQDTNKAVADR